MPQVDRLVEVFFLLRLVDDSRTLGRGLKCADVLKIRFPRRVATGEEAIQDRRLIDILFL